MAAVAGVYLCWKAMVLIPSSAMGWWYTPWFRSFLISCVVQLGGIFPAVALWFDFITFFAK